MTSLVSLLYVFNLALVSAFDWTCTNLHETSYHSTGIRASSRLSMVGLDAKDFFPTGKTMARYLDLKNRPPPVKLPRRRMELAFAVQLMRTSYNAFDSMDFTPTDIFQKNQFLFR